MIDSSRLSPTPPFVALVLLCLLLVGPALYAQSGLTGLTVGGQQSKGINRLPSPQNANEARELALTEAFQTISNSGITVDSQTIKKFKEALAEPSTISLNPIAEGSYRIQASFAGFLLAERVIKNTKKRGISRVSVVNLSEALKSLCPIWPLC